jgi:general secretion pathway protein I
MTAAWAPRRARGYTLIEVVVAFALLAAALTLLLGTLSGAARQVRGTADAGRAALYAQSLLAGVGVGAPIEAGATRGEFEGGRYRWRLDIQPWNDPSAAAAARIDPGAPRLLELRLELDWGTGTRTEQLRLRTLRLIAPRPEARG